MSIVSIFTRFVGPAALTAAGMIGAGAVATRLLAGAWFGFDLLWVAILVIPMVIFTLDSASRIGILSGGRGLLEMVRTDIGAWLAWTIFLPHGAGERRRQHEPDVGDGRGRVRRHGHAAAGWRTSRRSGLVVVTVVLTGHHRGRRRARRLQADGSDHDGAAGRDPLVLHRRRDQGAARLEHVGGAGQRPGAADSGRTCRWSARPIAARNAFTQIMAIAGQALPPAVLLSYGYLAANSGYTVGRHQAVVLEDGAPTSAWCGACSRWS